MMTDNIFREYDIRGVAGEDITRDTARTIGKALATMVLRTNPRAQCLSVGRDVRISSGILAEGVIEGIVSTGLHVLYINTCPTPLQYFSLFHLDLDGGIMVTGSHNPPEYNGFKLSVGKDTIHGQDIQLIKEIIRRRDWREAKIKDTVTTYGIIDAYTSFMVEQFAYLADDRYKKFKVVVDAGNGADVPRRHLVDPRPSQSGKRVQAGDLYALDGN